jgi:endonuclease/exonuclease/phosphatase family metal-dependent hydrolase
VTFDPYAPYGPLVESALRVVTWNVWGRYGPAWETRQIALEDTLAEVAPDVICLVEAWRCGESSQPARVASRLGLPHHQFVGDWQQEDWVSGVGLVSRWPMSEPQRRPLRTEDGTGAGEAVHVVIDGERGAIRLFAVMLDYPLGASDIRQAQVKQLASFVREVTSNRSRHRLRRLQRRSRFRRDQDAHRPFRQCRSRPGVLRQLGGGRRRLARLYLV